MRARGTRRGRSRPVVRYARVDAPLEYRILHGWIVQAAAWTRSWTLLRFASRFVRIQARGEKLIGWVDLDVRPQIERDGSVSIVPLRAAQ